MRAREPTRQARRGGARRVRRRRGGRGGRCDAGARTGATRARGTKPVSKRTAHVVAERVPLERCKFVKTEEFCWSSTQNRPNLQACDQA